MCGITGYIGKKEGLPIVFNNLKKLEYRGYDSAGIAFFNKTIADTDERNIKIIKAAGKLVNLERILQNEQSLPKTAAIAHTRWATHGSPTELNAHPHTDCRREVILVHNGIIENYRELQSRLSAAGHHFRSQTDTEAIAHLIEAELEKSKNFYQALDLALKKVVGAYALAIIYTKEPHNLYIARLGSPLVIGVGRHEFYVASDPMALAGLVNKVIYLKDGQRGLLSLTKIRLGPSRPKIEPLNIDAEQVQKGDFSHFMLKEIFEGPEVVISALRGRLFPKKKLVKLGGLENVADKLATIKKLDIIACGTSYYAGLIGELLFEEVAGLPTEVTIASEYRYRRDPTELNKAVLFISQSGETADTLAALKKAKNQGYLSLGLVNVVGSSIARETDAGVYNHAGPEIGVASTKAFLSQLAVLTLMALYLCKKKSLLTTAIMKELAVIPEKIRAILDKNDIIRQLAKKYSAYNNFFYLGRGYNYPTALEGALKLKEISYVHAEGYGGGEMKHGPLALIDKNFPTLVLINKNRLYDKMLSNLEEIKARHGKIIAIATNGDKNISRLADDIIYVPETLEQLEPMINIVPLQLFAYYFAVERGRDVDKPRNLAKSVTVE